MYNDQFINRKRFCRKLKNKTTKYIYFKYKKYDFVKIGGWDKTLMMMMMIEDLKENSCVISY